tara:strand:+ start:5776 stop:7905 length:2130 start_codon:yes stop_codon:yes gene_type:complete
LKQIIQDIKNGKTSLEEIPVPRINSESVLIKSTRSLVSLGTERMLVDFGRSSYIQKARQQPEKVRLVLDKMKTDGIFPTLEAVFNKLDQPMPLGYCNVGVVEKIGSNVLDLNIGDRVISNGNHAEYVSVPQNLVAKIPDNVTDEEAAFTVIGAIGLQGIRLLNPTFGETIVVIGLGLVGLITAEILVSNGCNVIGFDYDQSKVKIAKSKGVNAYKVDESTKQVDVVKSLTNNIGADGIIITASSKSNEIISQSAQMCRKRGKVILVGVVGLNIARSDFYEKEISFQVSCSYGPGRYDNIYENQSYDYPIGYVRWTEKRNFNAILEAISKNRLNVKPLVTEKVKLEDFSSIYNNINNTKSIASILIYNQETKNESTVSILSKKFKSDNPIIGIIGSGNYTSSLILPTLNKLKAQISYIASSNGLSSTRLAKKFNINNSTTDYKNILNDSNTNLVFVTTRHDMHAKMILECLASGKHVFIEKPLCLNQIELKDIISKYNESETSILVGFNRRFSPMAQKLKNLIGNENDVPINIVINVNAGFIPDDSWIQDMNIGGGRVIGEVCHFIDLATFFTSSLVKQVCMSSMGNNFNKNTDNVSILLKYSNGSNASINYFSNGSKAYSKEKIEVYSQNRTVVIDNWKKMHAYGFKNFNKMSHSQDKGQFNQFKSLLDSFNEGNSEIIPFNEIVNTTQATFSAIKSLLENKWINTIDV